MRGGNEGLRVAARSAIASPLGIEAVSTGISTLEPFHIWAGQTVVKRMSADFAPRKAFASSKV